MTTDNLTLTIALIEDADAAFVSKAYFGQLHAICDSWQKQRPTSLKMQVD